MTRFRILMSGNFDQPPASENHDTASRLVREILDNHQASDAEFSPSGELYRHIERFQRSRGRNNTLAAQLAEARAMSSENDPEQRRRLQREALEASPLFVLPPPQPPSPDPQRRAGLHPPSRPPRRSMMARRGRDRPHTAQHIRFPERNRSATDSSSANSALTSLESAGRQLEAASSGLRALLDSPVPTLSSPSLATQEHSAEVEHNRRAKRRKLDTDKLDSGFTGFSYGKYGQVEPGPLKMEIVSCDGGIFEAGPIEVDYSAENVLKSDDSVYCTKGNRCNLVLRHQGATAFCLKELVIKAPGSGYTAPVQEGMVFISMTSDDLLTRTAQYQIQYSPSQTRRPASERAIDLPPIVSIRHNDDGSLTTSQARARRLYDIGLQDEECNYRTAQIPSDFTVNTLPFQVTTECSDSEAESSSPSRTRRLPRYTGPRFDESDSPESDGIDSDDNEERPWYDDLMQARSDRPPRLRRRETASNITLAEAVEASQIATQEAVRAVGGELMAPHARFFIERDKSKCTVRFDPPVSGRFILLKMWSPHSSLSGNIDIKSVVAKGFAGPRYFPAVTLR
ncbi:hypothetical protein PVAG01_01600 [Phlyctema vagabunda]|uniref:Regulator of chromosome condensation-like protein n=1 Tax=Phlyctema vagabunda TaxID=108571 RepID=A0ABR4PYY7_9HELO